MTIKQLIREWLDVEGEKRRLEDEKRIEKYEARAEVIEKSHKTLIEFMKKRYEDNEQSRIEFLEKIDEHFDKKFKEVTFYKVKQTWE